MAYIITADLVPMNNIRHLRWIAPLLAACLLSACGSMETDQERSIDATWTEVQTISGSEEIPESLMNQPRALGVHPDGYVIVADANPPRVLIYEANGNFHGTIGREGQGPGEYENINQLFTAEDGSIVVQDHMSGRFQWFDIDGNLLGDMTPPQFALHLEPQADGYLAIQSPRQDSLLFYHADEKMRKVGEPFGPLREWIDWDDPVTRVSFHVYPPVITEELLFTSPQYYGGHVYALERVDATWANPRVIGGVSVDRAYEVKDGMQRGDGLRMFTSTDEGPITVIPENVSLGQGQLPDGYIINVLALKEADGYVLGIDVFNEEGAHLGFAPLDREEESSLPGLALGLHHIDEDGRLYFTDARSASIRVFEVELDL